MTSVSMEGFDPMKKLLLIAADSAAFAFSAQADTSDFHRAKNSMPVSPKTIPEAQVQPVNFANAAFGGAIEQMVSKRGGVATDPSGRFSVQVAPDGAGQVIRLISLGGTAQPREWKLGSGAGDRVISATIAELMTATGQQAKSQLSNAMAIQPLSGTLKN
jgi:hypothetical protein